MKGLTKKVVVNRLLRYVASVSGNEDEIPTAAGMANYLGMTKEELFALERSEDADVRKAYCKAMNDLEHFLLSGAAFKRINSSLAALCLKNLFGYGKESDGDDDLDLTLTVAGEKK